MRTCVPLSSKGSIQGQFRRALDAGNLMSALALAHDVTFVSLLDALDLCRLLAAQDDPLYPKAASRWLARLIAERGATLSELQLGAAALGQLWEDPQSELALGALRGLVETSLR